MDYTVIAPIIEQTIRESLQEKVYRFGFAKYQGLSDKVASGKLKNSVNVQVKDTNDGAVFSIFMEEYYIWVQNGRLPGKKGVPVDAIENWIKDRGLTGRDKKGRFIKRQSFAFAIQKNIKKFGIRPSNFLDVAFDKLQSNERLLELIGEESFDELVNLIEGI
jgi:hypothetical protein